jgi:hypothetical protein
LTAESSGDRSTIATDGFDSVVVASVLEEAPHNDACVWTFRLAGFENEKPFVG